MGHLSITASRRLLLSSASAFRRFTRVLRASRSGRNSASASSSLPYLCARGVRFVANFGPAAGARARIGAAISVLGADVSAQLAGNGRCVSGRYVGARGGSRPGRLSERHVPPSVLRHELEILLGSSSGGRGIGDRHMRNLTAEVADVADPGLLRIAPAVELESSRHFRRGFVAGRHNRLDTTRVPRLHCIQIAQDDVAGGRCAGVLLVRRTTADEQSGCGDDDQPPDQVRKPWYHAFGYWVKMLCMVRSMWSVVW